MNTIHQNSNQCRTICIRTLITLFMIAILGCSQDILAQQWTTTGNDISNTNSGNVGVGTTTPDIHAKLHVFKPPSAGIDIQSSNSGGWSRLRLVTASRTYGWFVGEANEGLAPNKIGLYDYTANAFRMMVDSSGNVGIGTSTPGAKLDIGAGAAARGGWSDFLIGPGGNAAQLELYHTSKSAAIQYDGTVLSLFTNGGAWLQAMVVDNAGNVGIGTVTPNNKLQVAGSITVDGNIAAKYQDVAEWVEASQPLPAATVVVLNSNKSNHVVASSRAYDTRVAGVISSQPGLILGERAENKVLVATTGRVKIKADAAHGAIRVGDLLVTSNKEGIAMKSRPISVGGARIHRPGTIIGKALEPLAKGQGEILVLLSLQ